MAGYTPKEWECGEVVNASDLNHIEEGITLLSTPLVISYDHEGGDGEDVFDTTWQDAYDAFLGGRTVLIDNASRPSVIESPNMEQITAFYCESGIHWAEPLSASTSEDYLTKPNGQ